MKKWVIFLLLIVNVSAVTKAAQAFLCVEPIPPTIEFDPSGMDFGSVSIGASKTLSLSVTYHSQRFFEGSTCICRCSNPDHVDLSFSVPSSSGYSLGSSVLSLSDGQTGTIPVTFRPTGAQGIFSSVLTVHSSARPAPYSVILTGVGFTGQGNIDFSDLSVSFGTVEVGTLKTKSLSISNSGTSYLNGTLSAAAPFSVNPTNFSIAPNGTISISVRFNPTATGDVSGALQVTSDDPDASVLALSLTGKGGQRYATVQPTDLGFGTIPGTETRTKRVTITNTSCATCDDAATLQLSSFVLSGTAYSYTPPDRTVLAPGESTSVSVTFTAPNNGEKAGALTFHTNDPLVPSQTVNLDGFGTGSNLDPSATTVDFGDTHLGATNLKTFSIRNKSSSATLVLSNVASSNPRVTVTPSSVTLSPGATQSFQARYTPSATNQTTLWNENLNAAITVTSNDSGLPSFILETTGRGVSPVIGVTPIDGVFVGSSIDLGTVYEGDSRVFRLKVSNTGNEALSVQSVSTTLPSISPQSTTVSVNPLSSAEIGVLYHPAAEGSQTATLSFASNDFFTPAQAVSLKGTCVSDLNLGVSKIEATQSIQKQDESLALVAGKATFIRAFVSSTIRGAANTGNTIRKVDGVLHLYKNGSEAAGSPFSSSNGPISVAPSPDRQKTNDTINFLVPANVLNTNEHDEWRATVEINPASGSHAPRLMENSYDDNVITEPLTFFDTYKPLIYYIPMSIKGYPLPTDDAMVQGKRLMEKIFPIASVRYVRRPPIALNVDVTYDNVGKVLQALFFASHLGNVPPPDRTYGWFPVNYSSPDFRGYSEAIPGRTAVGGGLSSVSSAQETFAHEMGHTYGLCHTNATLSESCPLGYSDEHLPSYEDVPEVGFDVDTQQTVIASKDIMTTKTLSQRWIHPQRYQFLFQRLRNQEADPADARGLCTLRPSACDSLFQPVHLVSGSFADDGTAELHPVMAAVSVPDEATQDFNTAYAVRLVGADGQVLLEYPINAATETGLDGDPMTEHVFSYVVPDLEGLTSIQIVKGDSVLAERAASAHPPTLALDAPSLADTLNVSWTASDDDGDPLLFSVLYSVDGGTSFQTIGIDLATTAFSYDASKLPGGNAIVRVMASDGFHTVSQDSAAFPVPTKAPVVQIDTPSDGQTVFAGSKIAAEAEADDVEDGLLDGDSIHWKSDVSGELGTGRLLTLDLPAGHHTLTVTAKDKDGKIASKTAVVDVVDGDQAPHANAGDDQKATEESNVGLDGSRSLDPDEGDALNYEWTQIGGPSVVLDDNLSAQPSFLTPKVAEDTDLKFRLTVTDRNGRISTDFADILVENAFYSSLHLSDRLVDFGIIATGQTTSHSITVSNQGNENLIVSGAEPSRADFSTDAAAFTLAPGESRTVTVTFRPTEEATFDSNIRFVSDTIAGVPTRLLVKGGTPNPKIHYNDNGLGTSLLPSAELLASASPVPDSSGAQGGSKSAGGCSLIR